MLDVRNLSLQILGIIKTFHFFKHVHSVLETEDLLSDVWLLTTDTGKKKKKKALILIFLSPTLEGTRC